MVTVEKKRIPGVVVASVEHNGPYHQVRPLLREVCEWVARKGSKVVGPPVGVYYEDRARIPHGSCKSELCVPIVGGTEGDGRIRITVLPVQNVAATLHRGPYHEIDEAYERLRTWAKEHGYVAGTPVREIYLRGPEGVAEGDLFTEVQVPIARPRH